LKKEDLERREEIKATLIQLLKFLSTETGISILLCIGAVIVLGFLYYKRKQIPNFFIEVLQEDTWFVSRDDSRRLAMVVSLKLTNKSSKRVQFRKCKLSGYSPKEKTSKIYLEGIDKTIPLDFPSYEQYYAGLKYYVEPYSVKEIWLYYESRSVTTSNMIKTPLVIKDANRKRKSVRVSIPRNMEQIAIYREAATRW